MKFEEFISHAYGLRAYYRKQFFYYYQLKDSLAIRILTEVLQIANRVDGAVSGGDDEGKGYGFRSRQCYLRD
ncbi:hypothetical protein U1Q18_007364 [Sarracenia purpurea var. burkii]